MSRRKGYHRSVGEGETDRRGDNNRRGKGKNTEQYGDIIEKQFYKWSVW